MLTSSNRLIRSIVLAAAVAAALAVASCGDDEPSTGTEARNEQPPRTTDADAALSIPETPPPESPHPVTSDIKKLRKAFLADDVAGICRLMTSSAKIGAGTAVHSQPTTCVRDVRKLFRTIEKGNGWEHEGEPRVTGMSVEGRRAIALMSLGQQLVQVPFSKVGGSWKLDGFFGTPREEAVRFAREVRRRPFPAAVPENALGDTTVEVRDAGGSPCPPLSDSQFPQGAGGCEVHAASQAPLQLSVLTPFGDFAFDKCTISYRVLADRAGRTWTDTFDATGPTTGACGDVNACFDKAGASVPWKGRLRSDGEGGFFHRMNACIFTCVGSFTGDFVMHMRPEGKGWRAEPMDGGGQTGFRIAGAVNIPANGVEIEGAGDPTL
ncbi:MAG TPA: hypothetical protein VEX36_10320 [Thermoleophilaceae bacterium]|nr:hypothetical protein [Thermoleophilaceae bacterium]